MIRDTTAQRNATATEGGVGMGSAVGMSMSGGGGGGPAGETEWQKQRRLQEEAKKAPAAPAPAPVAAPAPAPAAPAPAPAAAAPANPSTMDSLRKVLGTLGGGFLGSLVAGPLGTFAGAAAGGSLAQGVDLNSLAAKISANHAAGAPTNPGQSYMPASHAVAPAQPVAAPGAPAAAAATAAPAPTGSITPEQIAALYASKGVQVPNMGAGMNLTTAPGGQMANTTGSPITMASVPAAALPQMPTVQPVQLAAYVPSSEQQMANRILAQRAAGAQTDNSMQPAIQMAMQQAQGNAPSAALLQQQQAAERIAQQQMAAAYARGGYDPGAVRGAQHAGAQAQSEAAANAAILRAQEMQQGRAQLGQLLGQQGALNLQAQGLSNEAAQAYASQLGNQAALGQQSAYQAGALNLQGQQLAQSGAYQQGTLAQQAQQLAQQQAYQQAQIGVAAQQMLNEQAYRQAGLNLQAAQQQQQGAYQQGVLAMQAAGLNANQQQAMVDAILRSRGLDITQQQGLAEAAYRQGSLGIQQQQVDQATQAAYLQALAAAYMAS